ncbi:hypothetical protein [Radiobacillus sp. PE A8.2]|uniref:hypothetical protein n=1 Tax=Radiobacillus sp. PE A8.2 TaxID=3380349 RepID=UPI00388F620C
MDHYELFLESDGKCTYISNYVKTVKGDSFEQVAMNFAKKHRLIFIEIKQLLVIPSEKNRVTFIKRRLFRKDKKITFVIRKRAINYPWEIPYKIPA